MRPEVLGTIATLRERVDAERAAGRTLGLVPTMGALHLGHARLIDTARAECDRVIVSVFVNPLQFDRRDDLDRYPRTLDADVELCRSRSVDMVFAPTPADMYPSSPACTVRVSRLADTLCGAHRPGHFDGVATVVLKLFQMAAPSRAYFGEKDAQQLAIIRRMVRDLNLPVSIVGVPTVREPDGLAMSSRNRHLNAEERKLATALPALLTGVSHQIRSGGRAVAPMLAEAASGLPASPLLRLEYLQIVEPDELQPVDIVAGRVLVAGALWVGTTRLIDNLMVTP